MLCFTTEASGRQEEAGFLPTVLSGPVLSLILFPGELLHGNSDSHSAISLAPGPTHPECSARKSNPVLDLFMRVSLSSVQSLSRVGLCDPTDCSAPGLPVHHQLPELAQTHVHPVGDAIQPSHPLSSPSFAKKEASGRMQGGGKGKVDLSFQFSSWELPAPLSITPVNFCIPKDTTVLKQQLNPAPC